MFQKKISYGKKGFPWLLNNNKNIKYKKGICPVAERLQAKEFLSIGICNYDLNKKDALKKFVLTIFFYSSKKLKRALNISKYDTKMIL